MATISARIDDQLKIEAEQVADDIGIPLSTAINIFLKRFSAERGFPFDVVAPGSRHTINPLNRSVLEHAVKAAIAAPEKAGRLSHFTYLDPDTGKLTHMN